MVADVLERKRSADVGWSRRRRRSRSRRRSRRRRRRRDRRRRGAIREAGYTVPRGDGQQREASGAALGADLPPQATKQAAAATAAEEETSCVAPKRGGVVYFRGKGTQRGSGHEERDAGDAHRHTARGV